MLNERRAHTTLPAVDMARATKFYEETLGCRRGRENEGAVMFAAGDGTEFVVFQTPNEARAGHTQMGFTVLDLETEMEELRRRGVVFEDYDFPGFKTQNGIADTGATRAAWFKDPEGNMIGLVEFKD